MTNQIQIKLRKKLSTLKASKAFSLVELLVVIAVIGIIAAIAIPNIAGITGSATAAKTQRNSQSVTSAMASARAAGNVTAPAADTVTGLVNLVTTSPGLTGVGTLSTSTFYVPLSAAEKAAVIADTTHLSVSGAGTTATLLYTP
jgi:prepilin-type N-terminal cleavage/methylation domain-containing protein